ncbi:MAG TPA: pitrilysin family protein [Vicinamibacterales bacterium]|nr:pitrilysin family protein [Vicinamibacterales bacterium]
MTPPRSGPLEAGLETRGLSPTRDVLANGVTILTKQTRTTPAVTLHASLGAGSTSDPSALAGVAHFMSRTVDRGTSRHSADQIAEELDSRGVSLFVSVGRHALSLVSTCLVEDFDIVLLLMADIITSPTFPPEEVDRRRGEIVTLIRQDEDSPAAVATDALMAMLYGDTHPYGRPIRGTVATAEQIDCEVLQRFHREHVSPGALTMAIVGDIEPGRARDAATAALGRWSAPRIDTTAWPPVPTASARRTRTIPMMNKSQTDIAYGFTAISRSDPDFYAYSLMNNILGQYSIGGRLGESIRERQGMAYYVTSSLDANVAAGPLLIRAGVNPSNVERAVQSIDRELASLRGDGPTEQEVAESKQYLIGSLPRALETNAGIASFLQTIERFELGLDYDVRMPGLVQQVTRDEVHAAARRAIDPSKATVVVAGPYDGPLT